MSNWGYYVLVAVAFLAILYLTWRLQTPVPGPSTPNYAATPIVRPA